MEHNFDILGLPPIVLEKVPLSAILELLKKRANKQYMPSSYGEVEYNSKPRYTESGNKQFPAFPQIYHSDCSGYFCLTFWLSVSNDRPIFFNLVIGEFQIIVNLQTEQTIISHKSQENVFVEWKDDEEQTLPLNMEEVKEIINIYGH